MIKWTCINLHIDTEHLARPILFAILFQLKSKIYLVQLWHLNNMEPMSSEHRFWYYLECLLLLFGRHKLSNLPHRKRAFLLIRLQQLSILTSPPPHFRHYPSTLSGQALYGLCFVFRFPQASPSSFQHSIKQNFTKSTPRQLFSLFWEFLCVVLQRLIQQWTSHLDICFIWCKNTYANIIVNGINSLCYAYLNWSLQRCRLSGLEFSWFALSNIWRCFLSWKSF